MKKLSFSIVLIFLCSFLFSLSSCRSDMNVEQTVPDDLVIEERGIWLNRSEMFGPKEELLDLLDDLKKANFTSIYVNTYFRGSVVYPDSEYLPLFDGASEPDILSWLIPEIRKRGMRAEAWMEYGFYAYHVPDATKTDDRGAFLNKYPELTAIAADGMEYLHNEKWGDFYSLCPANPKSQELLASVALETLERYPFDGVNLDRIRFPNKNFCFCDYCKKHFKQDTGIDLKPFEKGTPEYEEFVKWRNEQLNRFMRTYAPQFRGVREDVTVSLASLPPNMMRSHSQPWDNWMEKGYLDAAMPMLYGEAGFEERVRKISGFPRWNMIFPGLDAHGLSPEQVMDQAEILEQFDANGLVIWYSGQVKDDLPLLKSGPFSRKAVSPLDLK